MIIVTGASGGLGNALLDHLAPLDDLIGVYNRTVPSARSTPGLVFERVNLEEPSQIHSFVNQWKSKLSKITLVHFAGLSLDGLAANYAEDDWDRVMRVNLKANVLLTQALLPHMIEQRWGRIVHISSVVGTQGRVGTLAYSTSKSGLLGMSRVLAKESGRFGVTSNVLVLGYFNVGLIDTLSEDSREEIRLQIPSRVFGDVANVANAIEFVIKSDFVNGAAINIDGGI